MHSLHIDLVGYIDDGDVNTQQQDDDDDNDDDDNNNNNNSICTNVLLLTFIIALATGNRSGDNSISCFKFSNKDDKFNRLDLTQVA